MNFRQHQKGGNLPFHPLLMFKILILQAYHGLSDDAVEYQIKDRLSFMNFLDLQMGDNVPDAKTIWDFKELIEKDSRNGSKNSSIISTNSSLSKGSSPKKEALLMLALLTFLSSATAAKKTRRSKKENVPKVLRRAPQKEPKKTVMHAGQRKTTRPTTATKTTPK